MTVKVVTDSTADLPASVIDELGITVVPLYVRFGEKVYRDRVDISHDDSCGMIFPPAAIEFFAEKF